MEQLHMGLQNGTMRKVGDARCLDIFFFQAEDGIRDLTVTGVQTCALPISAAAPKPAEVSLFQRYRIWIVTAGVAMLMVLFFAIPKTRHFILPSRSGGTGVDRKSVV